MNKKERKRQAEHNRLLGDISGIIRTQLAQNPKSDAIGIVFKREAWDLVKMAIGFYRKAQTVSSGDREPTRRDNA